MLLKDLPKEKIDAAINEIFEVVLLVGFVLGLGLLFLDYLAFESALNPEIPKMMGYFVFVRGICSRIRGNVHVQENLREIQKIVK
jgi:hypothetical protein